MKTLLPTGVRVVLESVPLVWDAGGRFMAFRNFKRSLVNFINGAFLTHVVGNAFFVFVGFGSLVGCL
ncbi:hypothetical protein PAESOLCIP111_01730 [Paenibacillus solanacearum]|uniref:Uncharacterized protein n=1 Tax=Paenibacillus solanacearum TaxID=2048548 RepID=A0A916NHI8_9BACL|nr:hypothetical protein [Paenibacillus solanacearum]CAG7614620.1 hypothetical protein PAESOLCIP111_01730 [Paenibacillus solanacearum]